MNFSIPDSIQTVLVLIVIAIIGILVKSLTSFLQEKKKDFANKDFDSTLNKAIDIVCSVVDSVSQTYVDDLKAEGKFDIEHQKEATQKAIEQAKDLLNENSKELIITAYNDLDEWIEALLADCKKTKEEVEREHEESIRQLEECESTFIEEYEDDYYYSPSCPWNAPGMSVRDFIYTT